MPMDKEQVHKFVETSIEELRQGIRVLSDNYNQWKNFIENPQPRLELPSLSKATVEQVIEDHERRKLTCDMNYLQKVKAALPEKNVLEKKNTALEEEFKETQRCFKERINYKAEINNWLEDYQSYLDNTVKMMDEELNWVRQFCRENDLPLNEILEENVKTEQMEH
ncbi:hypothetical protein DdX_16473 [Ditylenchus destructor]|uniref:Uncharacterized protein n=1 Tax=Ditylenchus destructor TaxID=166010 RepID=A0AAD4MQW0_9BILA|nr:hypothetical protein DdX_16473 [Ditylenchus destructor]